MEINTASNSVRSGPISEWFIHPLYILLILTALVYIRHNITCFSHLYKITTQQ